MTFKYPLQQYSWSLLDRLKIAAFVLNKNNRLTCGPMVQKWENQFEHFADPYLGKISCVATSSGSTANALMLEAFLQANKIKPEDTEFFCCSTTWGSNVSHLIMRGCKVKFVDINLDDLSFNYNTLEKELEKSAAKHKIVWITSLIGWSPNLGRLKNIKERQQCFMFADLCESTGTFWDDKSLLSLFDMSTTSSFLAHFISSIEGGILFIKDQRYYEPALSIRNHGLTRGLPMSSPIRVAAEKSNNTIDPQFLFEFIGTNYRLSDLHALYGILDTERLSKYIIHRKDMAHIFFDELDLKYKHLSLLDATPFCLPIITDKINVNNIKGVLNDAGWETRPIISFLPLSPAYKSYADDLGQYPNSQYLHDNGCYVGLNNNLKKKDVWGLVRILNRL